MPQYKHCKFLFLELEDINDSLSAPVDVIVPFDVVPAVGDSGVAIEFGELLVQLTVVAVVVEVNAADIFRATLLLARAVIRLFKSSRNNDFNGET
jgi:hypothetical protein